MGKGEGIYLLLDMMSWQGGELSGWSLCNLNDRFWITAVCGKEGSVIVNSAS